MRINLISTKEELSKVIQFVEPYESSCTTLMEMLLSQTGNFFAIDESGSTLGVFAIRRGKTIFHCLPFLNTINTIKSVTLKKLMADTFSEYKVFCVSGESSGSDFIKSALSYIHIYAKDERPYLLMTRDSSSVTKPQSTDDCITCTKSDEDALFPLQLEYQIEEVLSPGMKANPVAIRLSLAELLKTQWTFAISKDDSKTFLAKAGTNAIGKNYAQIGGVYTCKDYRNKGLAQKLIQKTVEFIEQNGKAPVLFVKPKNLSALAAYKNQGFSKAGLYKIIYF